MFTIKAPETFDVKVSITDAGGREQSATFTFRHKTLEEMHAFIYGEHPERTDVDAVMEVVAGWGGVDAPFGRESVALLLQNYGGAAVSIIRQWRDALIGARAKN